MQNYQPRKKQTDITTRRTGQNGGGGGGRGLFLVKKRFKPITVVQLTGEVVLDVQNVRQSRFGEKQGDQGYTRFMNDNGQDQGASGNSAIAR